MLYRLLREVARIALQWFYRSVEVEGQHRIPARGPVILAANHNNALVDALLIASSIRREVRLTAKATLLENPLTRLIVHAVGIVPLRRAADEAATGAAPDPSRNQGAFEAVVRTLAANGVVLIFPEGRSHSEPELAPLRTGCARMALHARATGVSGISIVPIGLTFEDKARPRSRVMMQVGHPILVDARASTTEDPVASLVSDLDAGLRQVTLNFHTHDVADRVMSTARLLGLAFDDVRSLGNPDPPLAYTAQLARRLEVIRQGLPQLDASVAQRVEALERDLHEWHHEASRLQVPLNDIGLPLSWLSGAWFVLRELAIGAAAGPVALWGRLNHWLPLRTAVWLGRLTSRNADEPAMHTLVGGVLLTLVTYAVIAALIARAAGWAWAVAYLVLLPPAASLDFWWTDRRHRATQRARGFRALRAFPQEAQWLANERDRLRAEVQALTAILNPVPPFAPGAEGSDPPDPSATHHGARPSADP